MKIKNLSIFNNQLPFWLAIACPFTCKTEVWVVFNSVFFTNLILLLLMKTEQRESLSFIWLSFCFNLYFYVSNRKSVIGFYSLPPTENSFCSSPTLLFCCFLDKVEKLSVSKKAKSVLISILLWLAQLVIHLHPLLLVVLLLFKYCKQSYQ